MTYQISKEAEGREWTFVGFGRNGSVKSAQVANASQFVTFLTKEEAEAVLVEISKVATGFNIVCK